MNKHVMAVLAAGCLWGTMGFFTRTLATLGINAEGAILVRCAMAALCFAVLILVTDRSAFRIRLKDFWCFFGSGVCALLFFTWCYFHAINLMSLSAAAILLYTAPTIVMLLSAVFFRERITPIKLAALVLAFAGCALVSGVGGGESLTLRGVLFGLGSGLGYALYSIFARFALNRGYSSTTVNLYSCLLAAIGAALIFGWRDTFAAASASWGSALFCLLAGAVTCFLPYYFYTYGLTGLETGKASILASVEPVVATLNGILIYHETMSVPAVIGVLLVLSAVVLLNHIPKERVQGSS